MPRSIMNQNDSWSAGEFRLSRRCFLKDSVMHVIAGSGIHSLISGCIHVSSEADRRLYEVDLVIGQRGLSDGRFQTPRAIAIDSSDRLFVIDKSGRVQSFDSQGKFLTGWRTPIIEQGKPTGVTVDRDGTIIVADTHYFRFLFYTPDGVLLEEKTIGGENGPDPGQFAFVTDIVRMPNGEFIMGEYGEFDRLHKYSESGKFLDRLGEHGEAPMQFSRPQSLALDEEGLLWVADACNHRIQVIDWQGKEPKLVKILSREGDLPGELKYPYGLTLIPGHVIVSEFGNHRVQKIDRDGNSVAIWGQVGSEIGNLVRPWAVAVDSKKRVYVVDSGNNRIQRFRL